jgi:predicted phosphodiesterase
LVEADTRATASTRGGKRALAALAQAGAGAVLSGHVHDPFDKVVEVDGHRIRIVGAGTLSQRLRSSRPSFNRLVLDGAGGFAVEVKSL